MKRHLLVAAAALMAAACLAGAARADTSIHAGGKTYTPAPNIEKFTASDGFVPQVALPTSIPYFVTRPPHGDYAQVYASRLDHVVWVPLSEASTRGWYVGHTDGWTPSSLEILVVIAVALGAAWYFRRRQRAT